MSIELPAIGRTVRSRSMWPQPSAPFGMSAAPTSFAPLMSIALMRAAEGAVKPASSRMYSRTRAAVPPATAVACEVPLRLMYSGSPLAWVPVPQLDPAGKRASSARPEHTAIPGAITSGLMRPSARGPCPESDHGRRLVPLDAPTPSAFFAVAGGVTPVVPSSLAENTGNRSPNVSTYWSTDRLSDV